MNFHTITVGSSKDCRGLQQNPQALLAHGPLFGVAELLVIVGCFELVHQVFHGHDAVLFWLDQFVENFRECVARCKVGTLSLESRWGLDNLLISTPSSTVPAGSSRITVTNGNSTFRSSFRCSECHIVVSTSGRARNLQSSKSS